MDQKSMLSWNFRSDRRRFLARAMATLGGGWAASEFFSARAWSLQYPSTGTTASYCPMACVGQSDGLYHYYCMRCPYPNGYFYGMSLPYYLTSLGCGSSQCVPAPSGSVPAPSLPATQMPAAMAPSKAMPVPAVPTRAPAPTRSQGQIPAGQFPAPDPIKGDPIEPGDQNPAVPRLGHIFGRYPNGASLENGLRSVGPISVPVFFHPFARAATYTHAWAWTERGATGFQLVRYEVTPPEYPGRVWVINVGHQVSQCSLNWPQLGLARVRGRLFQGVWNGEAYDIVLGC